MALLDIPEDIIKTAIVAQCEAGNLIPDTIDDKPVVFLAALYQAEKSSAKHLHRLNSGLPPWEAVDIASAIPWVEEKNAIQFSPSQKAAIETVVQSKLAIITGGPGVGKTTIVNSIIKIIRAKRMSIALCAPTGRAAKRLTETTGLTAKTIHRLLEYNPQTLSFKHNPENPLAIDCLVIDEASMIDIVLLFHLLKAIPDHAAVLFVGDVDQLPSVGPGSVLSDMIQSGAITTVKLTEIFRQAASSKIIINAHRINEGQLPTLNESNDENDFYTLYVETPEEIHDKLIQLVTNRIPKRYRCNAIADIQVLTPMNRGGLGARSLNIALQEQLNGQAEPKINRFGWTFAPGDKVIQNMNNYDKEVFNGDIGIISYIDTAASKVIITFEQRDIEYDYGELDEISLAYATSIHKSQGSEYPIIVIPLAMQHYMLLARNLLYTGVTRGKQLVILIAQKKALGMAVRNDRVAKRLTKLEERLG